MAYDGTGPLGRAAINTATGETTLVAAVADKKIKVLHYLIEAEADATIRFESGTGGTALTGQINIDISAGTTLKDSFEGGLFETAAGALLNLEQAGTVQLNGYLVYQLVE